MSISRKDFLSVAALGLGSASLSRFPLAPHDRPEETPARKKPQPSGHDERPPGFDPWVEVLPDNLSHNVQEVRRLAGGRPILAVVKNNGYGLALETLGPLLESLPAISGFAVVKGEEALRLRDAGIRKPILLMGLAGEEEGLELARRGVHLSVYTHDAPQRLAPIAEALGRQVDIQLYLDTGMSRMGMPHREALAWVAEVGRLPWVRVRGTFTALTEDREYDRVQLGRFLEVVEGARKGQLELGQLHVAASNGVFHLPESHLDLVRPGVALFGAYPSVPEEERKMARLLCAARLRARVVRVAHLRAGDSVSYGRAWIADAPTWVATLPVGHVDGYPREAVNGGKVRINGSFYPVIGAVSASHTIVKLGDSPVRAGETPPVAVGDLATLMGPDHPDLEPNVIAETLGVSAYDLLMHLNPSLPRVVVGEVAEQTA